MILFFVAIPSDKNTIKIGVSTGTGGKPKMALLDAKVPFWEGAPKGVLQYVINTIVIVSSAKHSFADMKGQKKTK